MRKYYAKMPLFHVYDDELTGTQKLLMFLLYADSTLDVYTLSYLARMRTEDVLLDLKELESGAICKASENRKDFSSGANGFHGTALPGTMHRFHGSAAVFIVSLSITRNRKVRKCRLRTVVHRRNSHPISTIHQYSRFGKADTPRSVFAFLFSCQTGGQIL